MMRPLEDSMTFTKFMAGVLLIAAFAYAGYLMDIPMMLIAGFGGVLLIVCLISGL